MNRQILFTITLILAACCHNACHALQKPVRSAVTLHFISKPPADSIMVIISDPVDLLHSRKEKIYRITDNYVRIEERMDHPGFIICEFSNRILLPYVGYSGENGMIFSPGDDVTYHIGPDYEKGIMNINFSGKGSDKYNVLKEIIRARHEKIGRSRFGEPIDSSFIRMQKSIALTTDILRANKAILGLETFAEMKQHLIGQFLDAPLMRMEQIKNPSTVKMYFNNYIKPVSRNFFDDQPLYPTQTSLGVISYLLKWNYFISTEQSFDDTYFNTHPVAALSLVGKQIRSKRLQQQMIAFKAYNQLLSGGFDKQYTSFLNAYLATQKSRHNESLDLVRKLIKDASTNLGVGKKAYEFALPDTTGRVIHQSDFKGRVVVLDFFFYGCVGCYQIAPVLDSLEKIYADKNVTFISVSIDRNRLLWKKGIGRFSGRHAVQLYTDGQGAMHPLIKYYNIGSYPTLMLIDSSGNIANARAPDPRVNLKAFQMEMEKLL